MTKFESYLDPNSGRKHTQTEGKQKRLVKAVGVVSNAKSCYGHKAGSQAERIDTLLQWGRFGIHEMAISCGTTEARIRQHLYAKLRDKLGMKIEIDEGGRVFNASDSVSLANNTLTNKNIADRASAIADAKIKHVARVKALNKANERLIKNKA